MKGFDVLIDIFADETTLENLRTRKKNEPLGPADLGEVFRGHFHRFTLYNPFALAALIVFTSTLFYPWWYAAAYYDQHMIYGYAVILQHSLPPEGLKFVIDTPRVAVAFLVCLLAGYVLLVFWGSTMSGMRGRLFIAFTGLCMLLYTAGFYGAVWYATDRIGVPVRGFSWIFFEVQVDIHMDFMPHYYRAIGAGAACLLSAALHGLLPIRLHRKQAGRD